MDEDDEEYGPVRAALAYPFEGETARSRLLVGTGVNFLAGVAFVAILATTVVLVDAGVLEPAWLAIALLAPLVYLPLVGYGVAISRALLEAEETPPGLSRWRGLVRDGSWATGVGALFVVPLVVLVAVGIAGASLLGGTAGTVLAALAGVLVILYALLLAYVLPAAVVSATHEGFTQAAFDLGTLREAATDGTYFRTWLAGIGLLLAGGTVGGVLSVVVVGFGVLFVAQVAATKLFTQATVEALDLPVGEEPPPPPASGYIPGWGEEERKRSRRRRLSGGVSDALLPTTPGGDDELDGTDEREATTRSAQSDSHAIQPRTSDGGRKRGSDDGAGDSSRPADDPGTDIEPADGTDESAFERYDS